MKNNPPLVPHPPLKAYYTKETERRRFISQLFDDTACEYDQIVRSMFFGSGAWYRKQALIRAGLTTGMQMLDVATGGGQVAQSAVLLTGQTGSVIGLDRSWRMLKEAEKQVGMPLVQAGADQLPFADNSFDFLSMSYALRHVDDLHQTFREYRRVLKPGGIMLILELTKPQSRLYFKLIRFYLKDFIPFFRIRLGSGTQQSETLMKYFSDTVEHCVSPTDIIDSILASGLVNAKRFSTFGIFSEYTALKPLQ
jgi:demethylmenaquinone methyltransferase/2-methoxy-6-polyprenyl-1,4-benzoquinol methylase